jgi:hypothetical protein
MLQQSRFAPHLQFIGDDQRHFGLFEGCGSSLPFDQGAEAVPGAGSASGTAGSCC